MRAFWVAVGLALAPMSAWALEPAEVLGRWDTQWANQAGEPVSGGAPLTISLDSPDALDGTWPSPGPDGVIHGAVTREEDGSLVWAGAWASVWPEGVTRGTFRFVFSDANTFTGVWASADGVVQNAAWNGQRAR